MKDIYKKQVALLLDILPEIGLFNSPRPDLLNIL